MIKCSSEFISPPEPQSHFFPLADERFISLTAREGGAVVCVFSVCADSRYCEAEEWQTSIKKSFLTRRISCCLSQSSFITFPPLQSSPAVITNVVDSSSGGPHHLLSTKKRTARRVGKPGEGAAGVERFFSPSSVRLYKFQTPFRSKETGCDV